MNLAISLLVAIAIASAIGTILQQNQPYNDYIIKFGPYWFEVFAALDLYDVYSASWFLGIMGFLLLSTSVCVYRNTPKMLHEMRSWRENVQFNSLQSFANSRHWSVAASPASAAETIARLLRQRGYQIRREIKPDSEAGDAQLLIARKGGLNRIGYILTHAAIVIICVGGLLDSRLPFKVGEWLGYLQAEVRNIPASEVPAISRLPVWNPSFRGSVEVPEGQQAEIAFVSLRDGYLVQALPFSIEVVDFRVEHHLTGQPKSFESDLLIYDDDLAEPLQATIAVNHPLIHKGYAIYQSSFGDGGSALRMRLWSLDGSTVTPHIVESQVDKVQTVADRDGDKQLEFTDLRLFNINPVEGEDGKIEQRNFGPSMLFRVRNAAGQAREYFNYMAPVTQNGQQVFLSGMRQSPADPYRFLHIPVDRQGGIGRFIAFMHKAHDRDLIEALAENSVFASMQASGLVKGDAAEALLGSMSTLVQQFLEGGFDSVFENVAQRVPEDQREQVFGAYVRVLQTLFAAVYREVLEEEGIDQTSDEDLRWFDAALSAISALPHYGTPFYLQLEGFDQVQASGLQITLSPGKNIVYLGCALLIIGVFMLFYIQQRRLWVWLRPSAAGSDVLLAGSSLRPSLDFDREFAQLSAGLHYYTSGDEAPLTQT